MTFCAREVIAGLLERLDLVLLALRERDADTRAGR
jgi:hypothetical protein